MQKLQAKEVLDKLPTKKLLAKLAGTSDNAHIDTIIEKLKVKVQTDDSVRIKVIAALAIPASITWIGSFVLLNTFFERLDLDKKRYLVLLARQVTSIIDHLLYYLTYRLGLLGQVRSAVLLLVASFFGLTTSARVYKFAKSLNPDELRVLEEQLPSLVPQGLRQKIRSFLKQYAHIEKHALKIAIGTFIATTPLQALALTLDEVVRYLVFRVLSKFGLKE